MISWELALEKLKRKKQQRKRFSLWFTDSLIHIGKSQNAISYVTYFTKLMKGSAHLCCTDPFSFGGINHE
jgi:hypothetical protein